MEIVGLYIDAIPKPDFNADIRFLHGFPGQIFNTEVTFESSVNGLITAGSINISGSGGDSGQEGKTAPRQLIVSH